MKAAFLTGSNPVQTFEYCDVVGHRVINRTGHKQKIPIFVRPSVRNIDFGRTRFCPN